MSEVPVIAIVDDDPAIRAAVEDLIGSIGYCSLPFASAEDFLSCPDRAGVSCMIVDVKMPGLSGIELQSRLNAEGRKPPMIFMTSYFDEATRARALAGGAFGFFGKPVNDESLIACLHSALAEAGTPH